MSAKSRKPSRPEPQDDLFGAIPATPRFDAFPQDLIARLTGGAEQKPREQEKPEAAQASPSAVGQDGQAKPSVEISGSARQMVTTVESGTQDQLSGSTVDHDANIRQARPTVTNETRPEEVDSPAPLLDPALGQSKPAPLSSGQPRRTKPTLAADTDPAYRNKLQPKAAHRTKNQRQLLSYLAANGNHITTYTLIADETGIPVGTIRDVLRKFEQAGLIRKSKHVQGGLQGLRITLTEALHGQLAGPTHVSSRPLPLSNPTVDGSSLKERYISNPSIKIQEADTGLALVSPVAEEARVRLLALTDEDLAFYYPQVSRAGFGREQLRQVLDHLVKQGKSPERLFTALEHAEFELGQGPLLDKGGQVVANPCGYLFNSLARTGYYRRPTGYVSAEEQASLDAEAEAVAVKDIQERASRAEFEAWLAGLGEDATAVALEGCKGPREQWLRHYYETRVRPKI